MPVDLAVWLRDDQVGDRVFAALVACVAVIAAIEDGVSVLDWAVLPVLVAGFAAIALWPAMPRWPVYIAAFGGVMGIVGADTDSELAMFIPIVSVIAASSHIKNRTAVAGYSLGAIAVVFTLGVTGAYSDWGWKNWVVGLAFGWGFGAVVHSYKTLLGQLVASRSQVAEHAVAVERRRIARDVHDLVGHSLSVVMLHLTGARRLVRRDPDEAEAALLQAEEVGRRSLTEIRAAVAMLRDESTGDSDTAPSPELLDLVGLVEEFRGAGLQVTLDSTGDLASVDGARGVAGYRIVQEALSNVSKHTADSAAVVAVAVDEAECRIRVENRGGRAVATSQAAGFGVVGMRERARSVGGLLVAGPVPQGWCVEAVLPAADAGRVLAT